MQGVSPRTTIGELVQSGTYGEFSRFFFTYMTPDHWERPLSSYGYEAAGFEAALARIRELAAEGRETHFQVYPETERLSSWDKDRVWLEFFPARETGRPLPWILILPGGGFNRHWGLIEGQAVATRANELGYPAFVLYYRVKQEPVMPLPVEDVARAVRMIGENAARFGIRPDRYMITGFSAGASIAGSLLTERFSPEKLGIPGPSAAALAYVPARFDEFYRAWEAAPAGSPEREGCAAVLRRVGGPSFTMAGLAEYDIPGQLDPKAPPVCLTANLDDPVVPAVNTTALIGALKEKGIPCRARIGKTGGHSYGLGYGLEAEGWFDEAVRMFEESGEQI